MKVIQLELRPCGGVKEGDFGVATSIAGNAERSPLEPFYKDLNSKTCLVQVPEPNGAMFVADLLSDNTGHSTSETHTRDCIRCLLLLLLESIILKGSSLPRCAEGL
jgi:hypothetical protein